MRRCGSMLRRILLLVVLAALAGALILSSGDARSSVRVVLRKTFTGKNNVGYSARMTVTVYRGARIGARLGPLPSGRTSLAACVAEHPGTDIAIPVSVQITNTTHASTSVSLRVDPNWSGTIADQHIERDWRFSDGSSACYGLRNPPSADVYVKRVGPGQSIRVDFFAVLHSYVYPAKPRGDKAFLTSSTLTFEYGADQGGAFYWLPGSAASPSDAAIHPSIHLPASAAP